MGWSLVHDVPVTGAMEVFTTDATMELLYTDTDENDLQAASGEDAVAIEGDPSGGTTIELDSDASCEFGTSNKPSHCLQKGEVIMLGSATSDEDFVGGELVFDLVFPNIDNKKANKLWKDQL